MIQIIIARPTAMWCQWCSWMSPGPQGSRGASTTHALRLLRHPLPMQLIRQWFQLRHPDSTCSAILLFPVISPFGTVNPISPPARVTCYCGNFLNLVPVAGITSTGTLDQSACVSCTSPSSRCGVGHPTYVLGTYNSVAVYAVTFWWPVQVLELHRVLGIFTMRHTVMGNDGAGVL